MAGSKLFPVDRLIGDAGAVVAAAVAETPGLFDASTRKEPYRLEGKETIGLEICEQLNWQLPDVIVCPTGGGVGLIAIDKAFQELLELGWTCGPVPRLVAVQAAGCAPIVHAFDTGAEVSTMWPDARTVAFGVTVPKALGDFLVVDAVRSTSGTAIAVSDGKALEAQPELATVEGMLICPEGALCFAAAWQLRESGWLSPQEDRVGVLNTGAGSKYPSTVCVKAPVLRPGEALPVG